MGIQNAHTCAPSADIGLWLTATIDISHTRPLLVRLFGGYVSAGNVPERWTTPAKTGQNAGDVPKTGTLLAPHRSTQWGLSGLDAMKDCEAKVAEETR